MCGIAGSLHFRFNPAQINAVMGHRGPDAQATFSDDKVQLHHLRLSIQDVTGGAQPMHYLSRYTIIYNGEIYNHQEVRQALNLQCQTNSDTETILHAFHQEGPAMLNRLDGMFALAIYDKQTQQLFLARDRAGKKPLYYYTNGDQFVFASELNALRAILPLEISEKNLAAYLRLGSIYRQQTPYQNVQELLQGHWMIIDIASMQLTQKAWWSIGDYYKQQPAVISEHAALDQLDIYLNTAVKRRLESSDLEVGSFLSGGIDSGLVTSMAAKLHPSLQTFTVSFEGNFNEAPLAKLVADKYNTRHHEIKINFNNLAADAEKIVAQYGEPFYDSSAIPSWYVSQAAAQHLTVVLNGDGADELFGGYRRYVPFSKYNFFQTAPAVRKGAQLLLKCLPPGHDKKSKYNFLYRLADLAAKKGAGIYLSATSDIFEGFEKEIIGADSSYLSDLQSHFEMIAAAPISGLRQLMWMDFDVTLFSDFLVKMDIATMAHSLEGRSPLLSKELLEWVPTLPDQYKINGSTTKYLLRKLAANYLPHELLNQPKRGFEVPLKNWVDGMLRPMVNDYLTGSHCLYPSLIDRDFVAKLLDNKILVSAEKRAKMLWTLTSLEIWHKHQQALYRPASANSFL